MWGYGIGELVVDVALHTYIAVGCGGVGVCEGDALLIGGVLGKWILGCVRVGLMWVMVGWVVRGGGCGERVVCGKWVLTGWF